MRLADTGLGSTGMGAGWTKCGGVAVAARQPLDPACKQYDMNSSTTLLAGNQHNEAALLNRKRWLGQRSNSGEEVSWRNGLVPELTWAANACMHRMHPTAARLEQYSAEPKATRQLDTAQEAPWT